MKKTISKTRTFSFVRYRKFLVNKSFVLHNIQNKKCSFNSVSFLINPCYGWSTHLGVVGNHNGQSD